MVSYGYNTLNVTIKKQFYRHLTFGNCPYPPSIIVYKWGL
jgi:hypothetical protein